MAYKNQNVSEPNRHQDGGGSRGRMDGLRWMTDYYAPDDFDPDEISWVTPDVAVTDREGGVEAKEQGHFVICVAGEMPDMGHVYIPVEPHFGPDETLTTLDRIADLTHWVVTNTEKKVVVHCAMGMERSVLSVVWYLHQYEDMTLDEAYDTVGVARPIAADRRYWIGM